MSSKKAVILFNLGGPDNLEAVKPFLFNLFNDPAIIAAPSVIRYGIAKLISSRREKTARDIYEKMGGKSPILEQTKNQAEHLKVSLNYQLSTNNQQPEYKVFTCMRYWHPRADEIVKDVIEYNPDEIILLPLYPQYSSTTTGSSIKEWQEVAKQNGLDKPTKEILSYEDEGNFIRAHAVKIRDYYAKAEHKGNPRILFSAHGLPKKIIDKGDPYQQQVEDTAEAIVNLLNIKDLDYKVCYQSKVGPMEWIGPSTKDEIIAASEDGGVSLVIVPIAFVSEHSETLVELDIEYKELAEHNGLRDYFRVPALGTDPLFISCLKKLVEG
jgi:ferrochelatase